MKKAIVLLFALSTLSVSQLIAQEKNSKSKLIEGIKKEKLRKPVKLDEANDGEKKTTSSQKKKEPRTTK
jgi:hypothetical protein